VEENEGICHEKVVGLFRVRSCCAFSLYLQQWFKNLPVITRYWFGLALLVTISGNLQIVNPWKFLFDFRAIKNDFEIWRVLTCFCYAGPFEFPTQITLYLLFTFSQQYEKGASTTMRE
jgi:hypothetical protein